MTLPTDPDEITGSATDEPLAPTPRWVKVFGAIVVAVMVLFVILLLGRGHGPGRHFRPADTAAQTPQGGR